MLGANVGNGSGTDSSEQLSSNFDRGTILFLVLTLRLSRSDLVEFIRSFLWASDAPACIVVASSGAFSDTLASRGVSDARPLRCVGLNWSHAILVDCLKADEAPCSRRLLLWRFWDDADASRTASVVTIRLRNTILGWIGLTAFLASTLSVERI